MSEVGSMAPGPRARPADEPEDGVWFDLVRAVLRDPSLLRLVYQPIVALHQAEIVGYEALSRFPAFPRLTPDRWFAAAERFGMGAELEAVALRHCLAARGTLPANCFVSVNVSPHLLVDSELSQVLLATADLSGVVIELTEHQPAGDLPPLIELRHQLAARGALLALDDAGSGYSGLQQITRLRPHLIKLDRALVEDADKDEMKLALAELLGEFGGRLDAWLLAEGIETWAECEAFLRLRVPLGQGYLFGRPGPPWVELDPDVAARLRRSVAPAQQRERAGSLVDVVPIDDGTPPAAGETRVRADPAGRPVALVLPLQRRGDVLGRHRTAEISLRVSVSTSIHDLSTRMITRPEGCRFDPAVCVDDLGHALGIIRLERVVTRLAELQTDRPPADVQASPPPRFRSHDMKQFSCGDVVPGCTRTFSADSEEAILRAVAAHASADHGLVEIPASILAAVQQHIHSVPA